MRTSLFVSGACGAGTRHWVPLGTPLPLGTGLNGTQGFACHSPPSPMARLGILSLISFGEGESCRGVRGRLLSLAFITWS